MIQVDGLSSNCGLVIAVDDSTGESTVAIMEVVETIGRTMGGFAEL